MIDPEIERIREHNARQEAEHREFQRLWIEALKEFRIESRTAFKSNDALVAAEILAWRVYLRVKRGRK